MDGSVTTGGESELGLGSHERESEPCLYQTWCPLLTPPVLVLDGFRIIQLIALVLVSENDNADAPSVQDARDNRTNPIGSAGAEINRMCGGLWEVNGFGPVEGKRENLFCDGPRDRGGRTP